MTKEEIFKKMFAYNENGEFVRREQLIDQEEETVEITIGDDTIKDLILRQTDPLTIQEKLRALFSYEEKKDDPYPINARELHVFLEIGKDFSNWIKDMIDKYNIVKDQDYQRFSPNLAKTSNVGRPLIEYYLSLDAAKIFTMVQKTDLGDLVRRYLIWAEKQLHKVEPEIQQPQPITEFQILKQMVLTFDEQQKQITEVKTTLKDQEERLAAVESSLLRKNEQSSAVINRNISVGEMANILKDMGYNIGRNGLFSWLTEKGFLTHYKRKGYKAKVIWESSGYFLTKKNITETKDGCFETYTIEITPKGHEWLVRTYVTRKD